MRDTDENIWELEPDEVRDIYIDRIPHSIHDDEAAAEFDNWLAKIKADAWDEGNKAAGIMLPTHPPKFPTNPYR